MEAFAKLNAQLSTVTDNTSSMPRHEPLRRAFVAMVAPPGRGKSGTLTALTALMVERAGGDATRVRVFNAGDVRRVWETGMKAAGSEWFESYVSTLGLSKDGMDGLRSWHGNASAKSIPGDVFSKVSKLNEVFATLCWTTGLELLASGRADFIVFDATNTNCARRDSIISAFQDARLGADVGLVFVENICTNQHRLLLNYASKLTASTDFRAHYADVNVSERLIRDAMDAVCEVADDRGVPTLSLVYDDAFGEIVREVVEDRAMAADIVADIRDILTRDLTAYQTKYVPMHVPCAPGAESTIDALAKGGHIYVQNVNSVCSFSGETMVHTNTSDHELVEVIKSIIVGEVSADYDSSMRHHFDEREVLLAMSVHAPRLVGGGSRIAAPAALSLALVTVVMALMPRGG